MMYIFAKGKLVKTTGQEEFNKYIYERNVPLVLDSFVYVSKYSEWYKSTPINYRRVYPEEVPNEYRAMLLLIE